MALDTFELNNLLENIFDEITRKVTYANRTGTLDELLQEMGLQQYIPAPTKIESFIDGKIVVIGQSEIKEDVMIAIAKKLGIKNDFEFVLEYYGAERYQYKKLQYAPAYRLVMFGPVPHSTTGKGDSSSVITEMESNPEMYPRVVRLGREGELKITKTGFKRALYELLDEGYLRAG